MKEERECARNSKIVGEKGGLTIPHPTNPINNPIIPIVKLSVYAGHPKKIDMMGTGG